MREGKIKEDRKKERKKVGKHKFKTAEESPKKKKESGGKMRRKKRRWRR